MTILIIFIIIHNYQRDYPLIYLIFIVIGEYFVNFSILIIIAVYYLFLNSGKFIYCMLFPFITFYTITFYFHINKISIVEINYFIIKSNRMKQRVILNEETNLYYSLFVIMILVSSVHILYWPGSNYFL